MKNILITGGTGLLGKALIERAPKGTNIIGTYSKNHQPDVGNYAKFVRADILDIQQYVKLFKEFSPDVVLHAASIGSPDFAEKNKELTWKVNVEGTKNILELCIKNGADLIFTSSNGIYDGDHAPYGEEDATKPLNYYGVTKLEAEKLIKSDKIKTAVVRPILMYGWPYPNERSNIVTLALSKLEKGEQFHAYDDTYSNPVYSKFCADVIWKIIDTGKFETYNVAGKERASIFGLLTKAAEVFELDKRLLIPEKQGYFKELVKRPIDTSYRTEKIVKILGMNPLTIKEGLEKMKGER
jgi:dTDP-4-dehydrorhamnose reductase